MPGVKFRVTISHCSNLPVDHYPSESLAVFSTVTCHSDTLLTTPFQPFNRTVHFNFTEDITIPYSVFTGSENSVTCCLSARDVTSDDDVISSDGDVIIGSATIDLAPLLIAFPCIEGWYMIEDVYSKDTFGQIKASFTPLELVTKEIIASKMMDLDESVPPLLSPEVTNFLKKTAKRNDNRVPTNDLEQPDETNRNLNIENVFQSLVDIDNMIKSIGVSKTNYQDQLSCGVDTDTKLFDITEPSASIRATSSPTSFRSSSTTSISSCKSSKSTANKPPSTASLDKKSGPSHVSEIFINEQDLTLKDCDNELDTDAIQQTSNPEELVSYGEVDVHASRSLNEEDYQEEDPCPLLDSFDITVDTTCLSDTINDITQLLQNVQRQTQGIDHRLDEQYTFCGEGAIVDDNEKKEEEVDHDILSLNNDVVVDDLEPNEFVTHNEDDKTCLVTSVPKGSSSETVKGMLLEIEVPCESIEAPPSICADTPVQDTRGSNVADIPTELPVQLEPQGPSNDEPLTPVSSSEKQMSSSDPVPHQTVAETQFRGEC